jgi:hypothetical protein
MVASNVDGLQSCMCDNGAVESETQPYSPRGYTIHLLYEMDEKGNKII